MWFTMTSTYSPRCAERGDVMSLWHGCSIALPTSDFWTQPNISRTHHDTECGANVLCVNELVGSSWGMYNVCYVYNQRVTCVHYVHKNNCLVCLRVATAFYFISALSVVTNYINYFNICAVLVCNDKH